MRTFTTPSVLAFAVEGELLVIHQVMAYQCIKSVRRTNRATVAGVKSSPTAGFYLRGKSNLGDFDVDTLARSGT